MSFEDCGCKDDTNAQPVTVRQLLSELAAEIAKMPSADMFDLPVGRVRQAFQKFYDIASSRVLLLRTKSTRGVKGR